MVSRTFSAAYIIFSSCNSDSKSTRLGWSWQINGINWINGWPNWHAVSYLSNLCVQTMCHVSSSLCLFCEKKKVVGMMCIWLSCLLARCSSTLIPVKSQSISSAFLSKWHPSTSGPHPRAPTSFIICCILCWEHRWFISTMRTAV